MKGSFPGLAKLRPGAGSSGYLLLAGAVIINIILQGSSFFSAFSLSSLFSTNLPLILASVSQLVIMLGGGIDLSIGNTMALVNGTAIALSNSFAVPVAGSWVIALLAGTAVGAANGLIIAFFRVSPLLATFAMSILIKGVSLIVLPKPGGTVPEIIYRTYGAEIFGVSTALWIMFIIIAVLVFLGKLKLSRHIVAVGSNVRNAYISGINVKKTIVCTYILGGLLAALAGLSLTALTASGDVRIGETFALRSIAAVIIGGTLNSGKWTNNILGSVCGALFLAIVDSIVFFSFNIIMRNYPGIQISTFYQQLLSNFIIIFGLASVVLTEKRTIAKE